jgi:hypothetical protein
VLDCLEHTELNKQPWRRLEAISAIYQAWSRHPSLVAQAEGRQYRADSEYEYDDFFEGRFLVFFHSLPFLSLDGLGVVQNV